MARKQELHLTPVGEVVMTGLGAAFFILIILILAGFALLIIRLGFTDVYAEALMAYKWSSLILSILVCLYLLFGMLRWLGARVEVLTGRDLDQDGGRAGRPFFV